MASYLREDLYLSIDASVNERKVPITVVSGIIHSSSLSLKMNMTFSIDDKLVPSYAEFLGICVFYDLVKFITSGKIYIITDSLVSVMAIKEWGRNPDKVRINNGKSEVLKPDKILKPIVLFFTNHLVKDANENYIVNYVGREAIAEVDRFTKESRSYASNGLYVQFFKKYESKIWKYAEICEYDGKEYLNNLFKWNAHNELN